MAGVGRFVSIVFLSLLVSCQTATRPARGQEGYAPRGGASDELVLVGRALFSDTRLSRDSSMSCATCHNSAHGFAEPLAISRGIGVNSPRRNAQSIADVGRQHVLTWTGRVTTLEDQAHEAFTVDGDMGIDLAAAVERVKGNRVYVNRLRAALGREPDANGVVAAIAAFQRSVKTGVSRFDCFLFGGDSTALSEAEIRGWNMFSKTGCAGCHSPFEPDPPSLGIAWFSDRRFHNLGVGYADGVMSDLGRYEVTHAPHDWGSFRTPSLRNVALTAPYMHDGSLATLEAVVDFYARGGVKNPNLDIVMHPGSFTRGQQDDIVAFLHALTAVSNPEFERGGDGSAVSQRMPAYADDKSVAWPGCRTPLANASATTAGQH